MSNMSYCRFRNTAQDLRDCKDVLEEGVDFMKKDLDNEEMYAAIEIIEMAREISEWFEDEDLFNI